MTIFKYQLDAAAAQVVLMPPGATIMTAQLHRGAICLWAKVDARKAATEARAIELLGDGDPMSSDNRVCIGTVQVESSAMVRHVFERVEVDLNV